MQVHALQIPDALVAWGKRDEIAVHFARPWAHDVETMVELARDRALNTTQTDMLLARLEGLVGEAIRAEEYDLLLGFDLLTAEWLDMTFRMKAGGRELSVGRNAEWSYGEIRALLERNAPPEAVAFAARAKALLADVFPNARIDAIIDTPETTCTGCGEGNQTVMLTFESGNEYCRKCWTSLTTEGPGLDLKKSSGKKKRR